MIQQHNFKEELDAGHSKSPRGRETFLFNVWFTLARIETMLGIEGNWGVEKPFFSMYDLH